ncbi:hypothetical protein SH139x_001652 [Planctomycetaceae bacterium SH139]
MASPFSVFRSNLKPLMVVLTLLSLFAFVALPALQMYLQYRVPGQGDTLVATYNGGTFETDEIGYYQRLLGQTNRFLAAVAAEVEERGGSPNVPNYGPTGQGGMSFGISTVNAPKSIVRRKLFAQRATELGLDIDNTAVDLWMRNFHDNKLSANELAGIRAKTSQNTLGQSQMYGLLKTELLANLYENLTLSGLATSTKLLISPVEAWKNFLKLNQQATVDAYPILVEELVSEVGEPAQSTILALYEEGKERFPNRNSPEPGFRRPYAAVVESVSGELDAFVAKEIEKFTEEELRAEYQKRIDQGQFMMPPMDLDISTPDETADPAAPAGEETPAGETPAGETPAGETPAGETPVGETPAGETPAGETPATEPVTEVPAGEEAPAAAEPAAETPPAEEPPAEEPPAEEPPLAAATSDRNYFLTALQEPSDPQDPTGQEPSATDPPAAEPSATDPPAAEPSVTEPSATEPPATEPPATEPPATEPPATEPPATEPPATEPPATEPPVTEEPVTEVAAPNEPQPFEAVRDQVARSLALPLARQARKQAMARVYDSMQRYSDELAYYLDASQLDSTLVAPERPNLQALAAENGLQYNKTPLVNILEFSETPIGSAVSQAGEPLPRLLFNSDRGLYYPVRATSGEKARLMASLMRSGNFDLPDFDIPESFLYAAWKIEDREPYTPELEDVREEVIAAAKLQNARELAQKRAEELAELANSQPDKPLLELVPETRQNLVFQDVGPFTWMQYPASNFAPPQITNVADLDNVGEAFMRAVFFSPVGQFDVAANNSESVYYVVKAKTLTPSAEELRPRFMQANQRNPAMGLSNEEVFEIRLGFLDEFEKSVGLEWNEDVMAQM